MKSFIITSVNISGRKGVAKKPVNRIILKKNHGIIGDAHAGDWHRQVSLLASEDIAAMALKAPHVSAGTFAENITTQGVRLHDLPIGTRIKIGDVLLEITQIGKECHSGCSIMREIGDCIMPKQGIFARVLREGEVSRESIGYYDF